MWPRPGRVKEVKSGMDRRYGFEDLVEIMDRLRGPDGCPWDREQDYATLRGYLLEECYEVVDALDDHDEDALREELGDLLFQIVFLSRIGAENGRFAASDVVQGIAEKMVRRHPHVFGDESADTSEEVLRNWEEIKRREKDDRGDGERSTLDGIPKALPALQKAHRLGTKAARVGFDWDSEGAILEKVDEEMSEMRAAIDAGDRAAMHEEYGDLLFVMAMLGRRLGLDPERSLEGANRKFRRRFQAVERGVRERGVAMTDAGLELMDRLWNEAKREEC